MIDDPTHEDLTATLPAALAQPDGLPRTSTGTIRIEPEDVPKRPENAEQGASSPGGDPLERTLESTARSASQPPPEGGTPKSVAPRPGKPKSKLPSTRPGLSQPNGGARARKSSIPPRPRSSQGPAPLPRASEPPQSLKPGPGSAAPSRPPAPPSRAAKARASRPPSRPPTSTADSTGRWSPQAAAKALSLEPALDAESTSNAPSSPPAAGHESGGVLRVGMSSSSPPPGDTKLEPMVKTERAGSLAMARKLATTPLTSTLSDKPADKPSDPGLLEQDETAEAEVAQATGDEAAAEPTLEDQEAEALDAGPPRIPSLAPEPEKKTKKTSRARRRRSRRGRRRTVKIPDDAVPATPTPPAVGVSGLGDGIVDEQTLASGEEMLVTPNKSVVADSTAIGVLRPIQIISDLPPIGVRDDPDDDPIEEVVPESDHDVPATSMEAPVVSKPPPPPRRGTDKPVGDTAPGAEGQRLESIEEIIPERMSLPEGAGAPMSGEARRPPPPPRSRAPSSLAQEEVAGGAPRTPPPPPAHTPLADLATTQPIPGAAVPTSPSTPPTAAEMEARAAAAEQAAREAEARLREAEARAEAARKKASAPPKAPRKPWYLEAFDSDFVRTLDNPKKRTVEREATFIEQSLRLDKGSRILDLACGTGVHAVELALRGYQMVGVDISNMMLNLAREYNAKRNASVSFIQGDMRQLNLEGVFDGLYCWSASLGYFDEAQNKEVIKRIAKALRPGGRLAIDVTNRDFVAPRAPSMAWFEKVGCVCMDESRFDFFTSRLITKRMVLFDNGKSRELQMSIRLYTLHELGQLLASAGLKVLEVSGHLAHRGAYFGHESPRIMITAQRAEDA